MISSQIFNTRRLLAQKSESTKAMSWTPKSRTRCSISSTMALGSLERYPLRDFWQKAQACGQPREVTIANLGIACSSTGTGL